jgi:hypothetical protein
MPHSLIWNKNHDKVKIYSTIVDGDITTAFMTPEQLRKIYPEYTYLLNNSKIMLDKTYFKLLNILSYFQNMKLKDAKIKTMNFTDNEKKLILELNFESETEKKTMILALDRDLTESESNELYERMIK